MAYSYEMCLTILLWGFFGVDYGVKWLKTTHASFQVSWMKRDTLAYDSSLWLKKNLFLSWSPFDCVKEDQMKHGGEGGLTYKIEISVS